MVHLAVFKTKLFLLNCHAREWMSPAVVTYFINELTVNAANNMDMLENLDWQVKVFEMKLYSFDN